MFHTNAVALVLPTFARNFTHSAFRWANCHRQRWIRSPFYSVCSVSQRIFISCKTIDEQESIKMILEFIRRRTSTYLVAVVASAFFIERTIQIGANAFFDSRNKGVSIFVNKVATQLPVALASYIISTNSGTNLHVLRNFFHSHCRNNGKTSRINTNKYGDKICRRTLSIA